jgi:hypothetical protein
MMNLKINDIIKIRRSDGKYEIGEIFFLFVKDLIIYLRLR